MKQVIVLKLEPSPEQRRALLETLEAFNRACQYSADVAYERRCANKIALQPLVYGELRDRFGLSSQMAIRAISKAVEAYKRDKRKHVRFDPHGAMVYDERIMSFKGLTHVSLLCLGGRQLIPLRYGAYQEARLGRAKGQADLVYRDGAFFLYVTIDLPEPPPLEMDGVLGIDLGIVNVATDSDGNIYSGKAVQNVRHRHRKLRQKLQSKGTRGAKRLLRKRRRKEQRFQRHENHVISKSIVARAIDTQQAVALEDLTHLRSRIRSRRPQRAMMHSWAFGQLRAFVTYKAQAAGVPVVLADPRNTSRTCPACGHVDKANRRSQSQFLCVSCGCAGNADHFAAVNIGRRGVVSRPYCSTTPQG